MRRGDKKRRTNTDSKGQIEIKCSGYTNLDVNQGTNGPGIFLMENDLEYY